MTYNTEMYLDMNQESTFVQKILLVYLGITFSLLMELTLDGLGRFSRSILKNMVNRLEKADDGSEGLVSQITVWSALLIN